MKKIYNLIFSLVLMIFLSANINATELKYESDREGVTHGVLKDGELFLYGKNLSNRFADSREEIPKESAIKVNDKIQNDNKIVSYYVSKNNTFVVYSDGSVYAAGSNNFGQLGVTDIKQSNSFIKNPITNRFKVKFVYSGYCYDAPTTGLDYYADKTYSVSFGNKDYCTKNIEISTIDPFAYRYDAVMSEYSDNGNNYDSYTYWMDTKKIKERNAAFANKEKPKKKGKYNTYHSLVRKYNRNGKLIASHDYKMYEDRMGSKNYSKYRDYYVYIDGKYNNGKKIYEKYEARNSGGKIYKYKLYKVNSKGKISYTIKNYKFKSNEKTKTALYTYTSNSQGKFKSTKKAGNAYRYTTKYKNGKAKKTIKRKYNAKGKLGKKVYKAKLRK